MKITNKTRKEVLLLDRELHNLISKGNLYLLLPEKVGDISIPKSIQFGCAPYKGDKDSKYVLLEILIQVYKKLVINFSEEIYKDPSRFIEEFKELTLFHKAIGKVYGIDLDLESI